MGHPRTLPLFDPKAQPSSWNERMVPGEYAVHYSHFENIPQGTGPYCTVFGTFAEAEQHAKEQVSLHPALRCRIYDHRGLVGPPLREIRGAQHVGESEITPRFRRWAGSILFFGGLALVILDWSSDFRLTWPATIGVRMLIPGLILLVTEAALILHAKHKAAHDHHQGLI